MTLEGNEPEIHTLEDLVSMNYKALGVVVTDETMSEAVELARVDLIGKGYNPRMASDLPNTQDIEVG